MAVIVMLNPSEVEALLDYLNRQAPGASHVRVAIDVSGVKVKVQEGGWTRGWGEVERNTGEDEDRLYVVEEPTAAELGVEAL